MVSLLSPAVAQSQRPDGLRPRPAAVKAAKPLPAEAEIARVIVKFHEGTHVRLRDGVLTALDRDEPEHRRLTAAGLAVSDLERDLAEAQRLIAIEPRARNLRRAFDRLSEELLAERKRRGERLSGRQLADLDLYYSIEVPRGSRAGDVEELVQQLNALPSVEIAYAETPVLPAGGRDLLRPAVAASTTPNYQGQQGYLNAAPQGIDALYAWTIPGGKGEGGSSSTDSVKIVDVEHAWNLTHEDLPALFYQGGIQNTGPQGPGWRRHGTAVLGELGGVSNSFGVTGIAHLARIGVESAYATTSSQAITAAAIAAGPGGVVLIEMQRSAPGSDPDCVADDPTCPNLDCERVALENSDLDFDAISTATANGTIVVEPAGNGGLNLDDPFFSNKFNRTYRDSGAILVGASLSTSRTPICQTNYGSRIDVHGWGENVVTTGYGTLYSCTGSDNCDYTANFISTSAASPMVAGSAAILQSVAIAHGRPALSPSALRQLLVNTGTAQVPGPKSIGPMPNLRAGIDALLYRPPVADFTFSCSGRTCAFDGSRSTDDAGIAGYAWTFGGEGSGTGVDAGFTFSQDASYTVTLTVTDVYGLTASKSRTVNVTGEAPLADQSYFAVPPCRLYDTRNNTILTSGQTRTVQVTGSCGVPATATAVAANVTEVGSNGAGYFNIYPGNLANGLTPTSTLNFGTANRANNAILRLATNGAGTLTVYPFVAGSPGQAHLIIDVLGYFSPDTSAASGIVGPLGYTPVSPCRLEHNTTLVQGTTSSFTVKGRCSVPAGAAAAMLNLTAINPSSNGHIKTFEAGTATPSTSTLNLTAGTSELTNGALTRLAAGAPDVSALFSAVSGSTGLHLDVHGYFSTGGTLKYHPLTPCRAVDTRSASKGGPDPLAGYIERWFKVQGNCGVPVGAQAVFAVITVVSPTVNGQLGAYPTFGSYTNRALSVMASDPARSNGVIVPLEQEWEEDLALFFEAAATSSVHAVVDVFGYFD